MIFAVAAATVLSFALVWSVAYPNKYSNEIRSACREFEVDENLVRAVIRTESKYRPDAQSRAGAVGLMQLMPSTAVWIAEKIGSPQSAVKLTEPSENIRLGTAYLKYLTEKYSLADALAAYNAGEGNLLRWRSEGREEYGFKETREYVKKVLRSKKVYEKFR